VLGGGWRGAAPRRVRAAVAAVRCRAWSAPFRRRQPLDRT
jgi:hypothetical protein